MESDQTSKTVEASVEDAANGESAASGESAAGDTAAAAGAPETPFVAYTRFPKIEATLEHYLGNSASLKLEERHRETCVRYLPWVAVLLLPLNLGAVITLLGLSGLFGLQDLRLLFSSLMATAIFGFSVAALPGLFRRAARGWTFLTYAMGLGVVLSVLDASAFSLVVDAVVLWLMFQLKYQYSEAAR